MILILRVTVYPQGQYSITHNFLSFSKNNRPFSDFLVPFLMLPAAWKFHPTIYTVLSETPCSKVPHAGKPSEIFPKQRWHFFPLWHQWLHFVFILLGSYQLLIILLSKQCILYQFKCISVSLQLGLLQIKHFVFQFCVLDILLVDSCLNR